MEKGEYTIENDLPAPLSHNSKDEKKPEKSLPNGGYAYSDDFSGFDIRQLWASVYSARRWIISIFVFCIISAIVATLVVKPVYEASSSVQINFEAEKITSSEDTNTISSRDMERFLRTQVDVIESRSVATLVSERLDLGDDLKFLNLMGVNAGSDGDLANDRVLREALIVSILQNHLTVQLPSDTQIVRIGFRASTPALAARVANGFAEGFLKANMQKHVEATSYGRSFLRERVEEAQQRLIDSQRKAIDYARKNQIVLVSDETAASGESDTPRTLKAAGALALNKQYSDTVAETIRLREKWKTARQDSALNIPEVINSPAVQSLLREKADASAALKSELERRQEDHPSVLQLQASLSEINRQLNSIASTTRLSLRNEYARSLSAESELRSRLETEKAATLTEQSTAVELGVLQREVSTNRSQYEALLNRFNTVNAEAGSQNNNLTIIDRAIPPENPVSPNLALNLSLALLAAIMLSGAYVYGSDQLFQKIQTPDDIKSKLGANMLGVVPYATEEALEAELYFNDPKSVTSEAYNSIRTALQYTSARGFPKSLAFSSTGAAEGKSNSCLALAHQLGRIGKRVIIIDLDLRRPTLYLKLKLPATTGASELISQQATLEEVIRPSGFDHIDWISSGAIVPNPAVLLNADALSPIIKELEARYDFVLVDSPPVLGLADAIEIGKCVESTLFVVLADRSPPRTVKESLNRLRSANVSLAGCILVGYDQKKSGYGYEYEYGAYKSDADPQAT